MNDVIKHGLGCLPYKEDKRDYKFSDLMSASVYEYPSSYISPMIPEFRLDQGYTSMCVSFAASTARYMTESIESNNTKLFSPGYIYGNRGSTDYKGEGMMVREALSGLVKNGVCFLSTLNCMGNYNRVNSFYETVKAQANKEAKPFRISSFYALYTDFQIKQAVISTGCAIVGYEVWDNWANVDETGDIKDPYGNNYGGHCVLIVGWTKDNKWIVLNSWGSRWGDNGIGYIKMSNRPYEAWIMLDEVQEVFFKSLLDIENHWAKSSIDRAVQRGILTGYEDGTFHPDNPITRAETCAIVAKLTNYNPNSDNKSLFNDVYVTDWFSGYVGHCYSNKFISGYTDGEFKPYNNLTRAEAVKILATVAKLNTSTNKLPDFKDISGHWAMRWIAAMTNAGYIKGYEDGTFRPDNTITRAEFITIIDRMNLMSL